MYKLIASVFLFLLVNQANGQRYIRFFIVDKTILIQHYEELVKYDLTTNKKQTIVAFENGNKIVLSKNGNLCFTVNESRPDSARIINTKTLVTRLISNPFKTSESLFNLMFSEDDAFLFNKANAYELSTGKLIDSIGELGDIVAFGRNPNDRKMVLAFSDDSKVDKVRLVSYNGHQELYRTGANHYFQVQKNDWIALQVSSEKADTLKLFNIETKVLKKIAMPLNVNPPKVVFISNDADKVFYTINYSSFSYWDVVTGKLKKVNIPFGSYSRLFSADGTKVHLLFKDSLLQYDFIEQKKLAEWKLPYNSTSPTPSN